VGLESLAFGLYERCTLQELRYVQPCQIRQ
jgi:hypothetical protein